MKIYQIQILITLRVLTFSSANRDVDCFLELSQNRVFCRFTVETIQKFVKLLVEIYKF